MTCIYWSDSHFQRWLLEANIGSFCHLQELTFRHFPPRWETAELTVPKNFPSLLPQIPDLNVASPAPCTPRLLMCCLAYVVCLCFTCTLPSFLWCWLCLGKFSEVFRQACCVLSCACPIAVSRICSKIYAHITYKDVMLLDSVNVQYG